MMRIVALVVFSTFALGGCGNTHFVTVHSPSMPRPAVNKPPETGEQERLKAIAKDEQSHARFVAKVKHDYMAAHPNAYGVHVVCDESGACQAIGREATAPTLSHQDRAQERREGQEQVDQEQEEQEAVAREAASRATRRNCLNINPGGAKVCP